MPLAGTENTLGAQIQTDIEAAILANEGAAVALPNVIDSLGEGVAKAVIPHFLSNVQILPGSFASTVPVTGIGLFL